VTAKNDAGASDARSKRSSIFSICSTAMPPDEGKRKSANAIRAVVAAHRVAHDHPVLREIAQRDVAGVPRMRRDRLDDVARDVAFVECTGAVAGDRAQRPRVSRIAQRRAFAQHLAVGVVQVGAKPRLRDVALEPRETMQARATSGTHVGERDRGLEQARPRKSAVLAMRLLEQPHHAGHADRPAADHRVVELERIAVLRKRSGVAAPGAVSRRRTRAGVACARRAPA
jgi:hypothetical protein